MNKFRFRLNKKGVSQLLHSDEMKNVLEERAAVVKNRCGDGYASDVVDEKTRAFVSVYASSSKARQENIKNNTLLKALK
ncbi:hypothetical protein [Finegoldia magna]|uniref:Phage protein n=1 Tax=Finegoldia magna TaxID=1260 RepID=A0A317M0Z8_FINMA|nr:hypothetical protein [Finegoldia magna]EGS34224.1 hypothetical protein HMPREF9489_0591 [Finegoldia magna SY403409CC001050417]MCC3310187.1 hypothetical protein [Finegoldia magna]PWV49954.1 hypothetical protein DES33_10883 [Finegoldia magna]QKH79729.1 hypothetical protein FOC70_04950 [Finegoldia magna]